jgi:hypothetical protein
MTVTGHQEPPHRFVHPIGIAANRRGLKPEFNHGVAGGRGRAKSRHGMETWKSAELGGTRSWALGGCRCGHWHMTNGPGPAQAPKVVAAPIRQRTLGSSLVWERQEGTSPSRSPSRFQPIEPAKQRETEEPFPSSSLSALRFLQRPFPTFSGPSRSVPLHLSPDL